MSRYPFQTVVNELLATKSVSWSPIYIEKMTARYALMQREFQSLFDKDLISTMNPQKMTVKDIKAYLEWYRMKTNPLTGSLITSGEVKRTIGALRHIVEFPYMVNQTYKHNRSLEYCLKLFSHLSPKVYHKRLPCWTDEQFDSVIALSYTVAKTELMRMRSYALACLSVCCGDRNKEIRYANVEDLDLSSWELVIRHPKGEFSYGEERRVPIGPECHHIVRMYIEHYLPQWHSSHPKQHGNPALFPSCYLASGHYMTDKSVLKALKIVQAEVGFIVTYQIMRRTYFQRLKNLGVKSESLSKIAGHLNNNTIQKYYAQITMEDAKRDVLEALSNSDDECTSDDSDGVKKNVNLAGKRMTNAEKYLLSKGQYYDSLKIIESENLLAGCKDKCRGRGSNP